MSSTSSFKKCVKCTNEGYYYSTDNKQAIYCKDCFLEMVHHKFSYSLGKHRVFKEAIPKNALIVFTGDDNSALLLSLICHGLSMPSSKRLRINPCLLFMLSNTDIPSIESQVNEIQELMKQYNNQNWNLYFVHIAAILSSDTEFESTGVIGIDEIDNLQSVIETIKDKSIKNELLRLWRGILLIRIARLKKCNSVVLPDNAEKLANDSFNALCFGRGSAISELTAVVDNPTDDVQFIRPFRDICDKEVQTYHDLHGSSFQFALNRKTFAATNSDKDRNVNCGGIQRKNADFIYSLKSSGFPATVPTILSIASKVEPSSKVCCSHDAMCYDGAQSEIENERTAKCKACFTTIISTQNVKSITPLYVCREEFNTCKPCAIIFDELASGTNGNICRKLMKIIGSI